MTRRDAAYQQIRSRLLSGALVPGTRLSHRALAREIGVSFIPVREAISQLVSEGLVEHRPRIGTFVTQHSREGLTELYDLREALECHVAEKVAGRLGADELAGMERHIGEQRVILAEMIAAKNDTWNDSQDDRWRCSDADFHRILLEAGGNCRLLKAVADLRVMAVPFGYRQRGRSRASMERIVEDHGRILAALRSGDGGAARAFMARHLRQGCQEAVEFYDRGRLQRATDPESYERQ